MKNVQDVYPLSPLQKGMLFHSLLTPESGVYFNQLSGTLDGDLNPDLLHAAWQSVIERHTILRTAFVWQGLPEPLQVVRGTVETPWGVHDWKQLRPAAQKQRMLEYLEADRRAGFQLSDAPLMRFALMRTGEKRWHFVWSHHHLLLDGWSVPVLLREVFAVYESLKQGQSAELGEAPPYRDYIAWLQRQDAGAAERFWRQELEGFHAPTPLPLAPTLSKAEPEEAPLICEWHRNLTEADTQALLAFSRARQVTMATLVNAAWAVVLGRYSGHDDVIFGSTVSSRPAGLAGVESSVGLFINTVPARIRLRPDERVSDFLQGIQESQADAKQYSYTSLADIQSWAQIPRSAPLFESILVYENYPTGGSPAGSGSDLTVRDIRCAEQTNYPLSLVVAPGRTLSIKVLFDSQRFDRAAMREIVNQFALVLRSMAKAPEGRLRDLPLLTPAARRRVVKDWNNTAAALPAVLSAQQMFEQQAERTPDAIALTFAGRQVTYRELNNRANRVAHALRGRGIGPEMRVALFFERSPEMFVAILGVLKSGAAYMPLAPEYPDERLQFMLADAGNPLMLTHGRLAARSAQLDAEFLEMDAIAAEGEHEPAGNPANTTVPENMAYIIYTSGSTGRPKGTMLTHGGLCNLAAAQQRLFAPGPGTRVLQFSSAGFDASVWEWTLALLSGGTLCLHERDSLASPETLARILRQDEIHMTLLPSAVLAALPDCDFPSLHTLMTGGEACPEAVAARWTRGRRFFNCYGPTEITVVATTSLCNGGSRPVTIGQPMLNAQAYILGENLEPLPAGIPGELYIGGAGVARGYLNRPLLTADRFVPDPFGSGRGARLYSTGDLARYMPDGNIEFLGRADRQVKIRGFRIEPGEIENVLLAIPGIAQAAVVCREEAPGDKRLVAYVAAHGEMNSPAELRRMLAARLPDYMIPACFVEIEKLPLTPSGKVDHKALPDPPQAVALPGSFVPPEGAAEEVMAGIWRQILHRQAIGALDNFFELGGHSLAAAQVVARAAHAFGADLPLRTIFECPTIRGLAARIEQCRLPRCAFKPLAAVPREGMLLASHSQERMWQYQQAEVDPALHNTPIALRLAGPLDMQAMERALNEIARRHEALRTTFEMVDGSLAQKIAPAAGLPLSVLDLSQLPQGEREAMALEVFRSESQTPFDLQRGPVLRTQVLRLDERDHVLLLLTHHISTDPWSFGILERELAALYTQFAAGEPAGLPELPVQYADYAAWQRDWLAAGEGERQLSYWQKQLAGPRPVLKLPVDLKRREVDLAPSAGLDIRLPATVFHAIRRLNAEEGFTTSMVLLAAYKTLLSLYSGQQEILVGSPVANRQHPGIEGIVGLFANTVVLRTEVSGDLSFRQLLGRVRQIMLDAHSHQDVPFLEVMESIGLAGAALPFRAWFSVETALLEGAKIAGLEVSPLPMERRFEKLDLTLRFYESAKQAWGRMEYRADLFEQATARRMLEDFNNLLEQAMADPDQQICELMAGVEVLVGN